MHSECKQTLGGASATNDVCAGSYWYKCTTEIQRKFCGHFGGSGLKFEFFSSIQRQLKIWYPPTPRKSCIPHLQNIFHSQALPMERFFSSHFKFSTMLCFFIFAWLWHFFEHAFPAQSNSIAFTFIFLYYFRQYFVEKYQPLTEFFSVSLGILSLWFPVSKFKIWCCRDITNLKPWWLASIEILLLRH